MRAQDSQNRTVVYKEKKLPAKGKYIAGGHWARVAARAAALPIKAQKFAVWSRFQSNIDEPSGKKAMLPPFSRSSNWSCARAARGIAPRNRRHRAHTGIEHISL
jgi:hypothetical protein